MYTFDSKYQLHKEITMYIRVLLQIEDENVSRVRGKIIKCSYCT